MSTAAAHPTASKSWPRWVAIAGWSVLGILGVVLLVSVATYLFGAVHGTEFCPQTFERRSYSYYELPIVRLQITGEKHDDLTGATELHVTSQKLIAPLTAAKKDWHVLVGSRGTRVRRPGDAGILMQYLDAMEGGNYHRWVRWSEEHDPLAKVFWPGVQQFALRELYVFMPDLFDLTKTISDPVALKQAIDTLLAQKLLLLARRHSEQNDSAAAIKALDEALALDPENAEIKGAREKAVSENSKTP
jgi:hypothetical protein